VRTTARLLLAFTFLAAGSVACNGGSGGPSTGAPATGSYAGHGSSINPIDFTVSNGVVSGVHGRRQLF
jgi:hypothetical protein